MLRVYRSLSGRLLILTILFVMLAEVLIFVPSVAKYRLDYFKQRIAGARIAAHALRTMPASMPSTGESPIASTSHSMATPAHGMRRIIDIADVQAIWLVVDGASHSLLPVGEAPPPAEAKRIDLRAYSGDLLKRLELIPDALRCLVAPWRSQKEMLLIDRIDLGDGRVGEIHTLITEGQARRAMLAYAFNILLLSLVISVIAGALVFRALDRRLVRPMRRVMESMAAFAADPEHAQPITAGDAPGEIGDAARGLSVMQGQVRAALQQKSRLAALGEAVAKINHDLRNMLAAASLVADRLEHSEDPKVRRMAPRLVRALDRAIALCKNTLAFGQASEIAPQRVRMSAAALLRDVAENTPHADNLAIDVDTRDNVFVDADPDQAFRALQNLTRNAAQAMEATGAGGRIRLSASRARDRAVIEVSDTGPGLPQKALDGLFQPFKGGASKDGSGLGLAIARELARAHGGEITLIKSDSEGATFRIAFPDVDALRKVA